MGTSRMLSEIADQWNRITLGLDLNSTYLLRDVKETGKNTQTTRCAAFSWADHLHCAKAFKSVTAKPSPKIVKREFFSVNVYSNKKVSDRGYSLG